LSHGSRRAVIATLSCVSEDRFADFKTHGNTKWRAPVLLQLAVLWSWETGPSLSARWQQATRILSQWLPDEFVGVSYGGFIEALTRWTEVLLAMLCQALRQRIQKAAGIPFWSTVGYPTFAIDGSKVQVPWSHSTDRQLGNRTLSARTKRRRNKRRERSANSRAHLDMRTR
jgi:hypothetical protein